VSYKKTSYILLTERRKSSKTRLNTDSERANKVQSISYLPFLDVKTYVGNMDSLAQVTDIHAFAY